MNFTLCGKSYDAKMSLGAIKLFNERTNKDLWYSLIVCLHTFIENSNKSVLDVTKSIMEEVDFLTAAEIFYCLAKQENKTLSIEEMEDAVLRVGWRPYEGEGGKTIQPYTLVLVDLAQQIDKSMHTIKNKKKAQTSD